MHVRIQGGRGYPRVRHPIHAGLNTDAAGVGEIVSRDSEQRRPRVSRAIRRLLFFSFILRALLMECWAGLCERAHCEIFQRPGVGERSLRWIYADCSGAITVRRF